MLLTNQINFLYLFSISLPSFVFTPENIIEGVFILFSIIIVSIGPIIHHTSKKLGEAFTKNTGNIAAGAALTNVALNFYNTYQNQKQDSSGSGGSSSDSGDNNSSKDSSKDDSKGSKDQIKKDNSSEGDTDSNENVSNPFS
jgi:hypothetical protein